ncbi:MAG: hypothetical protein ACLSB9_22555 [Hydrogeniiclostridium mannosilyticum]
MVERKGNPTEYEFYNTDVSIKIADIFFQASVFASRRDNVTFRLEMKLHNKYLTEPAMPDCKPAIRINFQAGCWPDFQSLGTKKTCRKTAMFPSRLAILSGKTDKDQYTIFLNVDHGIRSMTLFMESVR